MNDKEITQYQNELNNRIFQHWKKEASYLDSKKKIVIKLSHVIEMLDDMGIFVKIDGELTKKEYQTIMDKIDALIKGD